MSLVAMLAEEISSDSNLETYGWMGETPAVREFLTEREVRGMSETSYVVQNKEWEATIGVKRTDIEDDKLGALPTRIKGLAARAKAHADKLMFQTLENGSSATLGLCYDGTAFFGNSHTARGEQTAAQDNLLASAGTSVANLKTDLGAAIAQMRGFVDEAGEPFNPVLGELAVVAPPALEFPFREVLNASFSADATNVYQGAAKLVIAPHLTDAADWYLLHLGGIIKPLIFQNRSAIEFEALEAGTESNFMRGLNYYGTRGRYNMAYGFWQDAVKVA
jgi:phage major head subunit gpT-like protein